MVHSELLMRLERDSFPGPSLLSSYAKTILSIRIILLYLFGLCVLNRLVVIIVFILKEYVLGAESIVFIFVAEIAVEHVGHGFVLLGFADYVAF